MKFRFVSYLLTTTLLVFHGTGARSQVLDKSPEPDVVATDDAGTNLRSGKPSKEMGRLSIGAVENPTFSYPIMATSFSGSGTPIMATVEKQCQAYPGIQGCIYQANQYNTEGASENYLSIPTSTHVPKGYTEQGSLVSGNNVIFKKDGSKWSFGDSGVSSYDLSQSSLYGVVSTILRPDGETLTYNYKAGRLVSIVSSLGYMMHFEGDTRTYLGVHFPSKVVLINLAKDYCGPLDDVCGALTQNWPTVSFSNWNAGSVNATDNMGRISARAVTSTNLGNSETQFDAKLSSPEGRLFSYTIKSSLLVLAQGTTSIPPRVCAKNILQKVQTSSSSYTYNVSSFNQCTPTAMASTGSDGISQSWSGGFIDGRGSKTAFNIEQYNHTFGMIERQIQDVTSPEGAKTIYTRDARGNITKVTRYSKDGHASEVEQYRFPETCNVETYKICNKPTAFIDARGSQTDYEYSYDHGGLLKKISPPDASGFRAQKVYIYAQMRASYKMAPNQLAEGAPVWKLIKTSQCMTTLSCSGSSDEVVEETGYGSNLLPTSFVVKNGRGEILKTKIRGYDAFGNVVYEDTSGTGDAGKSFFFYNDARELIGKIGADPDASGSLPRPASRITLNLDGQPVKVDNGSVTGTTLASLNSLTVQSVTTFSYDSDGRLVRTAQGGGDVTSLSISDQSYDSRNRLLCSAVRMNVSAAAGKMLTPACSMGLAGVSGPDRIIRRFYDGAGNVLRIKKAVGTPVEQDEVINEYTANGRRSAVVDANGNRSELRYDGFDRQSSWIFPSKVILGQVDGNDYESYGYDANGNRKTVRRRDGRTFEFTYDALNRMTSKIIPDGCAPIQVGGCTPTDATRDVYYGYNLRGLQTYARFDSGTGEGVSNEYDALGNVTATTTTMGGRSSTLTFKYDNQGNRTSITHPDGVKFDMNYDLLSRATSTVQTGGAVIANAAWDSQGHLASLAKGGATTFNGYDAIGRLISRKQSFASGGENMDLGYNPAGQIISKTRDNDAYAFAGRYNIDRRYGVNGQNQYGNAGSAVFQYDANGNLISDGSNVYIYDAENRLVSASNGTSIRYDPLGRLWLVSGSMGKTRFIYGGDELTAEYDEVGNLLRRYVHGSSEDDPLVWYEGASLVDRRALMVDHQGSIIAVGDSSGNARRINTYDEYGIPGTGNIGRFQYTGQAFMPELGMYYYKSRIYSPTLGRFLQIDPIGYDDQINLYAYVGNDPVNMRDPTGKERCQGEAPNCAIVAAAAQNVRDMAVKTPEGSELRQTSAVLGEPGKGSLVIADPSLNIEGHFDPRKGDEGAIVLGDRMLKAGPELAGGALAHEGTHERDFKANGELKTGAERMATERHSYGVENEYRGAKGWSQPNVEVRAQQSFNSACATSSHSSCK